jgi:hypothetical protein
MLRVIPLNFSLYCGERRNKKMRREQKPAPQ